MLRHIVTAAALAGVTAGLLLTTVQHFAIAPLLRAAEVYEDAAIAASQPIHAHGTVHAAPAWSPREGWSRTVATAAANVILATGFALLLAAGMTLRRVAGARAGALWGMAGFLVFFVAPSIGLPPELPGSVAAPLRDREVWWAATVAATATGLWLMTRWAAPRRVPPQGEEAAGVFGGDQTRRRAAPRRVPPWGEDAAGVFGGNLSAFGAKPLDWLAGVIVLCAPHLVGAPAAPEAVSAVPPALAAQFLYATCGINAALWLVLGGLVGIALRRPGVHQRQI